MSDLERDTQTDPRRLFGRASSRVTTDMGYFDSAGVDQLRPTLTHLSEPRDPEDAREFSESSETLFVPATGPFDFEKTLRNVVKKYVTVPTTSIIPPLSSSGHQARPCGHSIAPAWCHVQRSPRRRLGGRC